MAIVQIENPFTKTIEQVEIAGDDPTQQELDTIYQLFQSEQPNIGELDFATASPDEIRAYANQLREAGLDPVTRQPLAPSERTLKDPGVDYTSGLQDFGLRAGFGARETAEEKAAYLTDKVGADGFRQDKGGRFILTQAGRTALGLGEGSELAIDEEGLSRFDVADFAGASGVPLAAGIGAGLLLSGTGV